MQSEQLNELAAALNKAQAEFSAIPKGSVNPFFKSNYAALPDVVAVATPVLTKHGLSVSQFIDHDGTHDTLTTYLLHASGQFIAQSMRLYLVKDDPQGQGSAVTYARRYSFMAVLGLVADNDDDGNAASASPQQRQAPKPAPAPQRAPQPSTAPSPATAGDKRRVSGAELAYFQYAEQMNAQLPTPKEALTDMVGKMGKYDMTAKQIGFASKLAQEVLVLHKLDPSAERKRIEDSFAAFADDGGFDDEPF
jgi:ERF superfamily